MAVCRGNAGFEFVTVDKIGHEDEFAGTEALVSAAE